MKTITIFLRDKLGNPENGVKFELGGDDILLDFNGTSSIYTFHDSTRMRMIPFYQYTDHNCAHLEIPFGVKIKREGEEISIPDFYNDPVVKDNIAYGHACNFPHPKDYISISLQFLFEIEIGKMLES